MSIILNKGFQFLEQRDSENNIKREGVVSKKSPFSTADNTGIYDVIAENLRVLWEGLCKVEGSEELSAIRDDIQKMYNDMRTNEKFGSVEATEQAKIAKEQATIATEKATEIANTLSDLQKEGKNVKDGILEIKANLADVKKYLEEIGAVQKDVADNAQVATNHANIAKEKAAASATSEANAKTSEENSLESEKKAKASEEAALASEKASKTSEEKAKASEQASATSEANALESENKAKASELAAKDSEDKALASEKASKESETKAKTSEEHAKTSENNAKESEEKALESENKAKASESNASTSETNAAMHETAALNSENKSREWAESDESISVTDGEGVTTTHKSAKAHAEDAKTSADKAKESEVNTKFSETNAATSETNAKESADKALESENNSRSYADKSKEWAESEGVVEVTTDAKTEIATDEDGNEQERVTEVKTEHYSAKHYADMTSNLYENALEIETATMTYSDETKAHMMAAGESESKSKESETKSAESASQSLESANKAKESETNAQESESNAKTSENNAKAWAMSDSSPDGQADEDGKDGLTQSSKTWATQAKEQAIEATKQKKEASQYAESVAAALKKAKELQDMANTLQETMRTLTEQAESVLSESKKIRDSISSAVVYQGSVETYADLPNEDSVLHVGFMYNVQTADKEHGIKAGDNVIWNGVGWDNTGGILDDSDYAKLGQDANFKAVTADTFTGALKGNADTATTADTAKSVAWGNVSGRPTSMTADGGTADRALKADVCTGNAATASSVDWDGVKNKPATFEPSTHSHSWSSVTDKPSAFAPSAHNHAWGNITGAPATATRWPAWSEVTGKPTSMPANGGTATAATYANYPTGFGSRGTSATWGKGNGIGTLVTDWNINGAEIAFRNNGGQLNVVIDGQYYANEGNSLVLHEGNYNSYTPTKTGGGASGTWGINITGSAGSVAWGNVSGRPSSLPANGGTSSLTNQVVGTYSGNGGQQKPNYYGRNRVGFLMSNQAINGDSNYKNWIYMDNYNGDDVGGTSAIGVSRVAARAFIMSSDKNRSAWNWSAELLSTANYNSYCPTKTGGGASGTWGINVTGSAGSVAWGNVSGKPSSFTPSSHTHAWSQVTGAPATATRWPSWSEVTGKPSSMTANGGTATNANYPVGFDYKRDNASWGAGNKIGRFITGWGTNDSGTPEIAFRSYNGQLNVIIDGQYYANEGENLVLNTGNYNNYAPTKTGGGASGTWGINISGWADNATKWNNLIQDTSTENNTDTWIPVLNNSKLQHTTKDAMVVGGAKNDGNGRNIVNTYATKAEIGLAGAIGWCKIGNTYFQWGQAEMSGATKTVDFRTKFPQAVGAVTITQMGDAETRDYRVNWFDVNQFEVQSSSTSPWRFSWIAVGR